MHEILAHIARSTLMILLRGSTRSLIPDILERLESDWAEKRGLGIIKERAYERAYERAGRICAESRVPADRSYHDAQETS